MKSFLAPVTSVILAGFAFVPGLMAQFGGRPGDVVIYALSPRNVPMTFTVQPPGTKNSAAATAQFQVLPNSSVPETGIPPGTLPPGVGTTFLRQLFHNDPDDAMFLVYRVANSSFPHRVYTTVNKTQLVQGTLHENEAGLDAPTPFYVTLHEGSDFGSDIAQDDLYVLFWTPSNNFPAVEITPEGQNGPSVPAGLTGWQWNTGSIKAPPFIPWLAMRKQYPGAGWQDGVDNKLIEYDSVAGNTTEYLRMRPGRQTPLFSLPGSTHLFILQGSVQLQANGQTYTMNAKDYAYIPANFAFALFNPNQYNGPLPSQKSSDVISSTQTGDAAGTPAQ
jgi:mannose-6-phosphate isomerase-like protein (cupin superfamily)